jgi:hypothetical protein
MGVMARWLIGLLLIAGCDVVWRVDHLGTPAIPADGRGTDGPGTDASMSPIHLRQSTWNDGLMNDTSISQLWQAAVLPGDLLVVFVAWNNQNFAVDSISFGTNAFVLLDAQCETMTAVICEAAYYVENAQPSPTPVFVQYSGGVGARDIRMLDYSGIKTAGALDQHRVDHSTGMNFASGPVSTTQPNELLVAGMTVGDRIQTGDPDFMLHEITTQTASSSEDRIVQTTGSYTASASQANTNSYVIELAAFEGQ